MTNTPTLPRLVALCGKPTSGKTTAAELLKEAFGYEIHDDGGPLREIAMNYFGLSEEDVYTQEGKLREIDVNGRNMSVRQLLGEIGEIFEERFGTNTVPLMSYRNMDPDVAYVIPSIRQEQGFFWKSVGAVIVEIDRLGVEESRFAFDRYNKAAVDHVITNEVDAENENASLLNLITELETALTGAD